MAKEKNDTAVSNEEIIAALMNSSTLAQAAQAAGISSRALYDRMGNADFRAEYRTAKAAIMRQATQPAHRLPGLLRPRNNEIVVNLAQYLLCEILQRKSC